MWTIYDHPLDFPEAFVVRRCFVVPREVPASVGLRNTGEFSPVFDVVPRLGKTLAEARSFVPRGLYRQPRAEADDPAIVETWF
jgi:hypothetical protein